MSLLTFLLTYLVNVTRHKPKEIIGVAAGMLFTITRTFRSIYNSIPNMVKMNKKQLWKPLPIASI